MYARRSRYANSAIDDMHIIKIKSLYRSESAPILDNGGGGENGFIGVEVNSFHL